MLRIHLESAVAPFRRSMLPLAVRRPMLPLAVSRSMLPLAVNGLLLLLLLLPLSGCGRKGALDPPPGGMILEQRPGLTPTTQRAGGEAPQAYDDDGRPIAPAGPKRRIPPDWLLD